MHITTMDDTCRAGVEPSLPVTTARTASTARATLAADDEADEPAPPSRVNALATPSQRTPSQRTVEAWRAWLGVLACDAEAALAAAMAY